MAEYKKIIGVEINDTIRRAIDLVCSDLGNAAELARRLGVSQSLPHQWKSKGLARPIKTIPHATYERLYPLIRAHLPPNDARYMPLSQRPGAPAQGATPVAPAPAGVVGLSESEQRLLQNFRDLDPDDQADLYQAIRAAARKAKAASAEAIRDADATANTG